MNHQNLIQLSKEVNIHNLRAYLLHRNWKEVIQKEKLVVMRITQNDDSCEVILPLDKQIYGDYDYAIFRALKDISLFENREMLSLLDELMIPPCDIIKIRVPGENVKSGTISFMDGFQLLESVKDILYSTATDILKPDEVYHKRITIQQAKQFVEKCRLGQTERGSFITTIICPFIDVTKDDEAKELSIRSDLKVLEESFTRKVTYKLKSSLNILQSSLLSFSHKDFESIAIDNNISGNFIESILGLQGSVQGNEIEIISKLNPLAKVEESIESNSTKFSQDDMALLEDFAIKLRKKEPETKGSFIGKISQVKADPDPTNREEGEIILNFLNEENRSSKAKVNLKKEDYEKACDAHRKGEDVKVKGILKNLGRNKIIENPIFSIVKD